MDTCIDWLDVAALSDRWRIIIPAIFSGMEALLVPETIGLKAEIVTVRSVAVHAALDHGFFDPGEIMAAYRLRSDLIHGTPTSEILRKRCHRLRRVPSSLGLSCAARLPGAGEGHRRRGCARRRHVPRRWEVQRRLRVAG